MSCPKCGLQTLPDQKFCRSCGADLQMTTRPLPALDSVSDQPGTPAIGSKTGGYRHRLTPIGFMIMFIGVAIGVVGKMLIHEEWVTVIGVLISLVGMVLTVYPYLSPSRRQKHESIVYSQPEVSPRHPTTYLPHESGIEYVPSITERTTDLLKSAAPTRPKKSEDRESKT
jgi:hypothetical protein